MNPLIQLKKLTVVCRRAVAGLLWACVLCAFTNSASCRSRHGRSHTRLQQWRRYWRVLVSRTTGIWNTGTGFEVLHDLTPLTATKNIGDRFTGPV